MRARILCQASLPADRKFDRRSALHILHRSTDALATEWREVGGAEAYAALHPFICAESAHGDLASLAATRGGSAATLRKTVSRMRQRFRHHVKAELARCSPTEPPPTTRCALLSALSG